MGLQFLSVKPKKIYLDSTSPQIFANTVKKTPALILELCHIWITSMVQKWRKSQSLMGRSKSILFSTPEEEQLGLWP